MNDVVGSPLFLKDE